MYLFIMKWVILAKYTVKLLCWLYSDSADGGIASELIATLSGRTSKGKAIENGLAVVYIDICKNVCTQGV